MVSFEKISTFSRSCACAHTHIYIFCGRKDLLKWSRKKLFLYFTTLLWCGEKSNNEERWATIYFHRSRSYWAEKMWITIEWDKRMLLCLFISNLKRIPCKLNVVTWVKRSYCLKSCFAISWLTKWLWIMNLRSR